MGCATGHCDAGSGERKGHSSRWRRWRKVLLLAGLLAAAGVGIGYYVLFVPNEQFLQEKALLESRQNELDELLGPVEPTDVTTKGKNP